MIPEPPLVPFFKDLPILSAYNFFLTASIRPVSMDSVTARFHIPTRHQD